MQTLSDLMASTPVRQQTEMVLVPKMTRNTSGEDVIPSETKELPRMPGLFEAEVQGELDRRLTASTEAFLEHSRILESEWPFRSSESQELNLRS